MAEEDMLYGKARHLFGGIEPSNMKAFSVTAPGSGRPVITAVLPDNTVIDGQTLCTVAGAVIRKKSTGYPKDEFDGEKVAEIAESTTFTDVTANADGTYYYAAYPFTTQGVYNRNPANRAVFNEPEPMAAFTSRLVYSSASQTSHVELTATLPQGAAGAVIRKSTVGYPQDEEDGEVFQNITASTVITDTDVEEDVTYYYSAFVYTSTGAYNRDPANRTSCTVYAGEAPDDMAAFSVVCDAVNQAKITATLPGNKTEGDVEICTVAGAIIRRKTGSYPVNETDGEEVTDLKQSGTYTDMGLTGDTIYYYAAFPYSDRGMFNRNQTAENQASCKVFAPVAPGNMKTFSASSAAAGKIVLTATLPDNTVESGVTTSVVAGVMIRRKLDGYPANETDGTLVANLTESGTYTDTDIVGGQMYYYGAFPYSDKGLYNQNAVPDNQASAEGKTYEYLYGYDLDTANSNPATRVTYPADVDNTGFAAAKMGTSAFNYGGWPSTPGEKFMPRPCMLTFAGKVDHYLNPNDYTKKDSSSESRAASGSSPDGSYSKVADTSFGGNAMMEWPKIFVKRWQEGNIYHFRVSDVKLDDDFECWSNYDRQNHEIEHFYTPIFFGSNVSSKLRSISGQANSVSTTADQEITYAKANGADWYTEVVADRMLINDLLTMMAKSTDLQTAYGSGRTKSSNSSAIAPGTMNTKGMFWGSTNGTDGVKVFGMENWWGNIWRRIAGWMLVNSVQKVKLTRGTKDGTTAADYNTTGDGYKSLSNAAPTGSSGGYISKCKTEKFGRFPYELSGSATTFECDAMWYSTGTRYASVGGNGNADLRAGPFCVTLRNAPSDSSSAVGAALSCKPLAA